MARENGSKRDNIDFRFALVDNDGVERYPYRIKNRDGRVGFAIGRQQSGNLDVVQTIEDVIHGVVFDGRQVRTTDFPPSKSKGSSGLSLAASKGVQGYRLDSSLVHLVRGAPIQPMGPKDGQTVEADQRPSSVGVVNPESLAPANIPPEVNTTHATEIADEYEPELSEDLARAGAAEEAALDPSYKDIPETTRRALINARIGQGGYRERMLKVWNGKCAVTGIGLSEVLVASHAKAWADCDNRERLDEHNGLLLSATIDRLFDKGLISFSDSGELLLRPDVNIAEFQAIGITTKTRLLMVPTQCIPYLTEHRTRFGFE